MDEKNALGSDASSESARATLFWLFFVPGGAFLLVGVLLQADILWTVLRPTIDPGTSSYDLTMLNALLCGGSAAAMLLAPMILSRGLCERRALWWYVGTLLSFGVLVVLTFWTPGAVDTP
jgi:hypothetical protein